MKVITPKEMADLESLAYLQGASDVDFMESAGEGISAAVDAFIKKKSLGHRILLLCGKGNNGGDAYAAGIHLLKEGYIVSALHTAELEECSALCQRNYGRFLNAHGVIIEEAHLDEYFFPLFDIVIDGIFGTGFKGPVQEPLATLIQAVNLSKKPIISIDIPSGLNGETGDVEGISIQATETVFLGLPKKGFFIHQGWNCVGNLSGADFGLPQELIDQLENFIEMLTIEEMRPLMPPLVRTRHKYQAGYVLGLSGSPQFPGAALLSSLAALRGGAGIVRLLHPEGMEVQLMTASHEIIKTPYAPERAKDVLEYLQKGSAVFVGPGLALSKETQRLLEAVLSALEKPLVLDADGLNFLAEHPIKLPPHTILTPHIGEMQRLLKRDKKIVEITEEFLHECQAYAEKMKVTLILKGGPSFIFHSGKTICVDPYGDPGMATAGSGDVLTGLLAALLAQGLATHDAACLGVLLHGLAGQYAAEEKTSYCMIASDILENFPRAFKAVCGGL